MPNHVGERRLWPPDSDNEADLAELLGVEPEQLAAMAPPGAPKTKRYKLGGQSDPFIHVGLNEFLAGVKTVSSAGELAVWVYILRERRLRRSVGPFPLANAGLVAWGITKNTKSRALQKLVAAGLITIEKHGHSSPWVQICSHG
jgi:hypothetical protein